tara:strand:- start:322 stop:624 length:303 start_codon:yes stop_codon:yes gene_type:complete
VIKLKNILGESWEDLGGMKTTVNLWDIYFNIQRAQNGDIYAYPIDQTRLFKAVSKVGYEATVLPLLHKINNQLTPSNGYYIISNPVYDPTKPLVFTYVKK